jgi:hypothetical protein
MLAIFTTGLMNPLPPIQIYILNLFGNNRVIYYDELMRFFYQYNPNDEYGKFIDFHIFELRKNKLLHTYYNSEYLMFFSKQPFLMSYPSPITQHDNIANNYSELDKLTDENTKLTNKQLKAWERDKERQEIQNQHSYELQEKGIRRGAWNNFWVILTFLFGLYVYYNTQKDDNMKSKILENQSEIIKQLLNKNNLKK